MMQQSLRLVFFSACVAVIALSAPSMETETPSVDKAFAKSMGVGVTLGYNVEETDPNGNAPMQLQMMPDKGLKGMGAVCLDGDYSSFTLYPSSSSSCFIPNPSSLILHP